MLLNLQAALANIDPAMEQAAANLGASRWTIFRRITLPLMRPGLFAGCTLVLIWSFTELGTPLMFQFYDVTPVQVFTQITEVRQPAAVRAGRRDARVLDGAVRDRQGGPRPRVRRGDDEGVGAVVAARAARLARLLGAGAVRRSCSCSRSLPHLSVILTSLSATGAWYKSLLPRELHRRPLPAGARGRAGLAQRRGTRSATPASPRWSASRSGCARPS